jgi:hypothetical protein
MLRLRQTLPTFLVLVACATTVSSPPKYDLALMPAFHDLPSSAQAAWLAYGAGLAHIFNQTQCSWRASPDFPNVEQEADALAYMVSVWEVNKIDGSSDAYLEDLSQIAEARFLKEYVSTYRRPPKPGVTQFGLNLLDFKVWRSANLANHKTKTLVIVDVESFQCPTSSPHNKPLNQTGRLMR